MTIKEDFTIKDCLFNGIIGFNIMFTACIAIARYSIKWMFMYFAVLMIHLIIEYCFFCTHCPVYCNESSTIKCSHYWGVPKFLKKRDKPLSKFDLTMVIIGFFIIIFFPLYWLLKSLPLLIIYIFSLTASFSTVRKYECVTCPNFNCPGNRVDEAIKKASTKDKTTK